MIKKFSLMFVMFAFVSGMLGCYSLVYAQLDISSSAGKIVISGQTDVPGDGVTLTAYPSDYKQESVEALYSVLDTISDENGSYRFEFGVVLSETAAEDITVFIKENEKENPESFNADFPIKSASKVVSGLKNAQDADAAKAIMDSADNKKALIALSCDEYFASEKSEAQKREISNILRCSIPQTNVTSEEFYKLFVYAMCLSDINTKTNVDGALEKINIRYNDEYYNDIKSDKLKGWIKSNITNKKYSKADEINSYYNELNILYIINNSKQNKTQEYISKYSKDLGISENEYCKSYLKLSGDSENSVTEKLRKLLYEQPASSADMLVDDIKKAISTNSQTSNGGTSGGSGGGGGGRATGGFSVGNNSEAADDIQKVIFTDLNDVPWAKDSIETIYKNGIISGVDKNLFAPNELVTREQFVKMLVLSSGIPIDNGYTAPFNDVKKVNWSYKYIGAAYKCGIVNGVTDDTFERETPISRQDVAVMAKRCADVTEHKISDILEKSPNFRDESEISDYAKDAVDALYRANIINGVGDGRFAPLENCTRAQAAKIICLLFFN